MLRDGKVHMLEEWAVVPLLFITKETLTDGDLEGDRPQSRIKPPPLFAWSPD